MGTLATFLMGMAGPLLVRALIAVGISTVTFTGVTVALQALIDSATANWASVPSDILALGSIAGIPQALGIICGAFTARVGMWVAVSATRFVTGAK